MPDLTVDPSVIGQNNNQPKGIGSMGLMELVGAAQKMREFKTQSVLSDLVKSHTNADTGNVDFSGVQKGLQGSDALVSPEMASQISNAASAQMETNHKRNGTMQGAFSALTAYGPKLTKAKMLELVPFVTATDPTAGAAMMKLASDPSQKDGPDLASKISDLSNMYTRGAATPTTEIINPKTGQKELRPSAAVNRDLAQGQPVMSQPPADAEASNKAYVAGQEKASRFSESIMPLDEAERLADKIDGAGPGSAERTKLVSAYNGLVPKDMRIKTDQVNVKEKLKKYLEQGIQERASGLSSHSVAGLMSAAGASPNMSLSDLSIQQMTKINSALARMDLTIHKHAAKEGGQYGYLGARADVSPDMDPRAFMKGTRAEKQAYYNSLKPAEQARLRKSIELGFRHGTLDQ